jgi:hypothetical protein
MKIGIVGSGYDMVPLMSVLNETQHEFHFFVDRAYWPWGDKSSSLRLERIQAGIEYLVTTHDIDACIVPPSAESRVHHDSCVILPLFETYLYSYVFAYSIVGKLWLLCEQTDMSDETQQLIHTLGSKYTLTSPQQKIKKFLQPFALWKKNVRMWIYFLTTYGRREPMLRKTIKYDLRYFTDAGVDTLVPMSWWFLFYQKLIKTRINWKKMRFHGLDAVQDCFDKITKDSSSSSRYSITLHCTDTPTPLLEERKRMDILSRGGEVEVKVRDVNT